jgi:hypothetical protein
MAGSAELKVIAQRERDEENEQSTDDRLAEHQQLKATVGTGAQNGCAVFE